MSAASFEMDDTTRRKFAATFDTVADDYEVRPPYPDAVFTLLAERCRCGPDSRVLEVGPGTGQATLRILDLGAEVTAVEPGAALARRLRERVGDARPFDVVVSAFETADLPDSHFDLAVAATSFHWVDPAVGHAKVARHLRPGGWIALWWNNYGDPERPDPFQIAIEPMLNRLAPELNFSVTDWKPYALDTDARIAEIDATGAFGPVEHHVFRWEGHHDAIGIRRLFATFSPWVALPEPQRTATLDGLEQIARDDLGDVVVRPYLTPVFLAQKLDTPRSRTSA